MPRSFFLAAAIASALAAATPSSARAQLLDQLKGAVGGSSQSNSGGGLLGGNMPSVGQASTSNTAGVLQYCLNNNYLGGNNATSVKDSLMSKLPGHGASDSGYKEGSSGVLQTGNGQSVSLGGGGLKEQLTKKVCEQILAHGKSLL